MVFGTRSLKYWVLGPSEKQTNRVRVASACHRHGRRRRHRRGVQGRWHHGLRCLASSEVVGKLLCVTEPAILDVAMGLKASSDIGGIEPVMVLTFIFLK